MTKFSSAPVIDSPDAEGSPINVKVSFAGALVAATVMESEKVSTVEVEDMRIEDIVAVEAKLNSLLLNGDVVLTGAGGSEGEVIEEFDPLKSSLSGKVPSIYATDDAETAIFNAVLDKRSPVAVALRTLDGGEGASSKMHVKEDGLTKFQIPQHMAEAIQVAIRLGPDSLEWRSLFRDGAVYALPKVNFTQDSPMVDGGDYPTDHEWNSQIPVAPEVAVLVSSELIADVLRFDGEDVNVEIISVDENMIVEQFTEDMSAAISDGLEELGAQELLEMAGDSEERVEFARRVESELGSERLPKDEFVRRAAEIYRNMLIDKTRVS